MDNQNPKLTFREFPISNWILGIIFLGLAATNLTGQTLTAGSTDFIFLVLEVAAGLFLILSGTILTINADRITRILTVRFRASLRGSKKEIPFSDIAAIQLEMNPERNRPLSVVVRPIVLWRSTKMDKAFQSLSFSAAAIEKRIG